MALIMMMLHLQQRWVVLQRQQINSVVYLHSSPKWLQKHWKAKTKNDNNIGTTLSSCQGEDDIVMDRRVWDAGAGVEINKQRTMGLECPVLALRLWALECQ